MGVVNVTDAVDAIADVLDSGLVAFHGSDLVHGVPLVSLDGSIVDKSSTEISIFCKKCKGIIWDLNVIQY